MRICCFEMHGLNDACTVQSLDRQRQAANAQQAQRDQEARLQQVDDHLSL